MAEQLGKIVGVDSKEEHAFPGPSSLLKLGSFPGLSERKVSYLRALARAAREGRFEASYLRSLPAEEALAGLKGLPGIGGFSAKLVLLRGVGVPTVCRSTNPGSPGRWRWPTV